MPTPNAYQRTVLPSLSGNMGISREAMRGSSTIAVSQGNWSNVMSMRINTYQGDNMYCTKLYKVLSMIIFDEYHQYNKHKNIKT